MGYWFGSVLGSKVDTGSNGLIGLGSEIDPDGWALVFSHPIHAGKSNWPMRSYYSRLWGLKITNNTCMSNVLNRVYKWDN